MPDAWTPPGTPAKPARSLGRKALGLLATTSVLALAAGVPVTQWMAGRLGHHPALGQPWFDGWYAPWSWLTWRLAGWPGAAPTYELMDKVGMGALCLLPMTLGWAVNQKRGKPQKHEGVHGTAKFAERDDMVAAGLLPAKPKHPHGGLYLGVAADGTYLRHQGPEPLLVSGPTRCGKSQGPVLLNCLSGSDESLIVYDIRGDLYAKSAGWRHAEGNRVIAWDITAADAARWNPLREVRLGTSDEFTDVANAIEIVADPHGEGLDNPKDHFPPVAADFLVSLALFVLHEQRARGAWGCFADVRRAMSDPDRPPQRLYEAMRDNRFGPGGTRHEAIAEGGADQLGRADRERASVLSTCTRMLRLFRDPKIARNTAASDFRLDDLSDGDRPAAFYIIPGEAHSQRVRPLVRLFFSMLAKRLLTGDFTGNPPRPHKHRGRLIWDEFPEAKRMDAFLDDMARLSATGWRTMLLVQDYQQLVREYGRDEPVSGHCHILIAYTPLHTETADWIEKWLGRTTLVTEDISESGGNSDGKRGYSRHYSPVSRPLMTADEIMRMPKPKKDGDRIVAPGKVLIKVGGHPTACVDQACYFFDPAFDERARLPPPPRRRAAA